MTLNTLRISLTLAAISAAALGMNAQSETPDTLKVIDDARRVVVTRDAGTSTTSVTVIGSEESDDAYYNISTRSEQSLADNLALNDPDWSPAFPFTASRHRASRFKTTFFSNTYIGAAIPVSAPDGIQTSVEAGFLSIVGISYRLGDHGTEMSIGAGMQYRQFAVGDGMRLDCDRRNLTLIPVSPDVDHYNSRIRSMGFTVPVMFTQKLYRSFGISLGAVLCLNSYTVASTEYHNRDGYTYNATFKGLHQRICTVDLMACVGAVNDIGVYVRYSPMRMFEKGYGPDMRAVSVGLTIGF